MAKFNIVYDSDSKELSVDIDGSSLMNVQDVHIYKYEEDACICVGMGEKKDKVRYYSRVEASNSENGKLAASEGTGLLVGKNVLILK